jgi:hypothetical protein
MKAENGQLKDDTADRFRIIISRGKNITVGAVSLDRRC